MMTPVVKTFSGCLLITLIITGCSTASTRIADYKKSQTIASLEIPPELSSASIEDQLVIPEISTTDTPSPREVNGEPMVNNNQSSPPQSTVLPQFDKVQIKGEGNTLWLVVQAQPDTVWNKVKKFWQEEGFTIKTENSTFGIMETDWAENRADLPQTGVQKLLGKFFDLIHSAATRDKFRTRLERGTVPGTTEIYLTHHGAEEVAKGDDFTWQRRPAEPALEAELLHRLTVYLGMEKQQATTQLTEQTEVAAIPIAKLDKASNGKLTLILATEFSQAWRQVGLALDRSELTIEDRDREQGIYYIRFDAEAKQPGFFARLFGSQTKAEENPEYLLHLLDEKQQTRIELTTSNQENPRSEVTEQILNLLLKQLN